MRPVAEALVKSGAVIKKLNRANTYYFDELGLQLEGTPFHWACQCRNHIVIKVLLDLGAVPIQAEGEENYHLELLFASMAIVSPEIAEVLLRHHKFYLNLDYEQKETIFYFIGMGGSNDFQRWTMHGNLYSSAYREILEVLGRYDIPLPLNPRAIRDIRKYTPLSRAAISHNFPLMKELLRLGANVDDLSHDSTKYCQNEADCLGFCNSQLRYYQFPEKGM